MRPSKHIATSQSWLDGAPERFAALNESLVEPTCAMLDSIIARPGDHARLLNTLALLEHTGSYRIMVSQHGEHCTQPTLRHLAEEAQHAFFMRRQAEKTADRELDFIDSDLLAGSTARSYFSRLEALIHGQLRREDSGHSTYLYMSMIIEFRALWFYGHYQDALKSAGNAISLKRIIGEEASHLTDMTERLEAMGELSESRVDTFIANEQRLYARLLRALSHTH